MRTSIEVLIASYLLNALWQTPLVYVAARVGAWLLRREDALWRHRLWVCALGFEVALPAISAGSFAEVSGIWRWILPRLAQHGGALGRVEMVQGAGTALGAVALRPGLLAVVAIVYVAVLVFFAGRLLWNLSRLSRIRRGATEVLLSAESHQIWEACRHAFGAPGVVLAESPAVGSPLTVGVRRRTVLLPPGFLQSVSAQDHRALFAHECAHVKRYDFGLNLLYELLALPIAAHPCLWWTRRHLVESREWVCDALAADVGAGKEGYARSLLRLATQLLATGPAKAPHAIGMLDANALERRLMHLTRTGRPSGWRMRSATLAGCAVLGTATAASAWTLHTPVVPAGFAQDVPAPTGTRIAGGVMAGNIESRVNPVYPPDARAARISGSVVLGAVIGKEGTIEKLEVLSGPAELRASAIEAVRQWVYKPYLLNGHPTEVQTTITVNYQLND